MTEEEEWGWEEQTGIITSGIFLIFFLISSTLFLYMGELLFSIVCLILAGIFSFGANDKETSPITILGLLSIFTIIILIILKTSWIIAFVSAILWSILIIIQLIAYGITIKREKEVK
jgi:hypothetical protein